VSRDGVVLALPAASHADDQKKAEEEMRKVTALTLDPAAPPLVSQTVTEFLKVPRADPVRERDAANVNYGSLFLIYRLATTATTVEGIPRSCMLARHMGRGERATRGLATDHKGCEEAQRADRGCLL
jgi:hypothetical protein